jgi:IS1 family transposase
MYLPIEKAEAILRLLLEGNSVSSVSRLTGAHIGTILRLLVKAGEKAEKIMAARIRNVQARDVELDEVWSFVGKKQKRVKSEDDQNLGDNWTFVAIERHSKLVINIAMGKRDQQTTDAFVEGIRSATNWSKFQISSDGFAAYRSAVTTTLEDKITGYAQLIKVYRAGTEGEGRYSPAEVASVEVVPVSGQPDPERICTSIVERSNLSTRMAVRRFLEEVGEPLGRRCAVVLLVQLRARPQIDPHDSGDGCWRQRSHLDRARNFGGRLTLSVKRYISAGWRISAKREPIQPTS